jgi:hypothetical protein
MPEPKAIIGAIEETFGYTISYGKAYQAKKKVLEHRWGTYETSYHNLPCLLHTIVQMNPGSYYDIKDYPCEEKPGKLVLQLSFLALGACMEAFKVCRPLICIDGIFLTCKYKGTILIVAPDSNNQLLHLAIAFAEGELLTVDYRIKVHMDLQADKSPVVVKGPFFPRVVNPRYLIH